MYGYDDDDIGMAICVAFLAIALFCFIATAIAISQAGL